MQLIKRAISKSVRGLSRIAAASAESDGSEKHIARNWLADASDLLSVQNAETIVDGGAYRGDLTWEMAKAFPTSQIHAFEPNPAMYGQMCERFTDHDRIHCHHAAISQESGEAIFNVTDRPDCASLLRPGASAKQWHGRIMEITREEKVRTIRLDEYFADDAIALLKLDLQGHEFEALKGAVGVLRQTKMILAEVSFVPFYDGQALYHDVAAFLAGHDFRLHYLCDVWLRPGGQATQADALFLNQHYFDLADVR